METLLLGLKGSLILTAQLLCVILPLTVSYEFLKQRSAKAEKKSFVFRGITQKGLMPLVTGVIIGLTYGAGIIIHTLRTSKVGRKEAFLVLLFLSVCHALIEDTLIFVVIGANGFILVGFRLALACLLIYLFSGKKLFKD
jgi:hypothetical protein